MKWCIRCLAWRKVSEYGAAAHTSDKLKTYCRKCEARINAYRRERRRRAISELKAKPCVDCGRSEHPDVMRLEPYGDRLTETRLTQISGKAFAEYVSSAVVVCLVCLDKRKKPHTRTV